MNSRNNTLELQGYDIHSSIYTETEVDTILQLIERKQLVSNNISRTKDVFAIRQLLNVVPELHPLIFNSKLKTIISEFRRSKVFCL